MPPALEPVRWRIANAAKEAFEAMRTAAVTSFFYPPDIAMVMEPPLIQYLDRMDARTNVVYGIFLEDETPPFQLTSLGKESLELMLWVQVAKRYQTSRQDPASYEEFNVEPEELQRSRLVHDARKVVLSTWRTLGGDNLGALIEDWQVNAVYPMFARLAENSGWIGFEMATTIKYEFRKNDPTST